MNIATRYAKALWETVQTKPIEEQELVYADMCTLKECLTMVPRLKSALANPVETPEAKRALLLTAGGQQCSQTYADFVDLVVRHRRANQMLWITHIYSDLHREAQGIVSVLVETATALDEKTASKLRERLETTLGKKVECHYKVRPELIGGFRIRVADKRFDASIQRRLEDVRESFLSI